jgi:hypothetical protein
MWIRSFKNHFLQHTAFYIFGISGSMGVLVDIDHVFNYYFPQQEGARFLHGWFAFISIIVLCGVISYIARLYCSSVLKDISKK